MSIAELIAREREQEAVDRALIEVAFDSGDYWGAATYALDPGLTDEVPRILWRRWSAGAVSLEQLREAIPSVWIFNTSPVSSIGERAWLAMFRAAGFLSQITEHFTVDREGNREEHPPTYPTELVETRPDGPLIVWRGASLESHGRGFSWTQYRDCAEGNFAQGWADIHQSSSGLYRAEVPGLAVLAIFGDDREQEIVVNPNMLRGRVELVATVQPGAL